MADCVICCPTPTYLASAVTDLTACPLQTKQIVRIVFWRTGNEIDSVATALVQTTWTTLLAATGDTKAVVTPLIGNWELEPGEAREFGGGNETPYGIPIRLGRDKATATFRIYEQDQDVVAAMKQWECEALDAILINECNQFIYSDDNDTFKGFRVRSLSISDLKFGNRDEPSYNDVIVDFEPNFTNTLKISGESTFALSMVNT